MRKTKKTVEEEQTPPCPFQLAHFLCIRSFELSPPSNTIEDASEEYFNSSVGNVRRVWVSAVLMFCLEWDAAGNTYLLVTEEDVVGCDWKCFRIPMKPRSQDVESYLAETVYLRTFPNEPLPDKFTHSLLSALEETGLKDMIPWDALRCARISYKYQGIMEPQEFESSVALSAPIPGTEIIVRPLRRIGHLWERNGIPNWRIMPPDIHAEHIDGLHYFMERRDFKAARDFDPRLEQEERPAPQPWKRWEEYQEISFENNKSKIFFENSIKEVEMFGKVAWRQGVVVNWGLLAFARWKELIKTLPETNRPSFREYAIRENMDWCFDLELQDRNILDTPADVQTANFNQGKPVKTKRPRRPESEIIAVKKQWDNTHPEAREESPVHIHDWIVEHLGIKKSRSGGHHANFQLLLNHMRDRLSDRP